MAGFRHVEVSIANPDEARAELVAALGVVEASFHDVREDLADPMVPG